MTQFQTFIYVCQFSGQRLSVRFDEKALWLCVNDVARPFGKKRSQLEKALKYLRLNREIDEIVDMIEFKLKLATLDLLLNHRAAISLGYYLNLGRVPPFRTWYSERLPGLAVARTDSMSARGLPAIAA